MKTKYSENSEKQGRVPGKFILSMHTKICIKETIEERSSIKARIIEEKQMHSQFQSKNVCIYVW